MSRFPLHPTLSAAPGLVAVVLVACGGRGPLDTDIETYDAPDAAGLLARRAGDDGAGPARDSGAGPTGLKDAGKESDGGDARAPGGPSLLAGFPGLSEDAGGILGCFACAEGKCGAQVNACVGVPACITEGTCGLGCLLGIGVATDAGGIPAAGGAMGGGVAGLGNVNLPCLQACDTNVQANADLFAALECTFTSCSSECLSALTPLGGGPGGLGGLGEPGAAGAAPARP
jgi:hypothetical protein